MPRAWKRESWARASGRPSRELRAGERGWDPRRAHVRGRGRGRDAGVRDWFGRRRLRLRPHRPDIAADTRAAPRRRAGDRRARRFDEDARPCRVHEAVCARVVRRERLVAVVTRFVHPTDVAGGLHCRPSARGERAHHGVFFGEYPHVSPHRSAAPQGGARRRATRRRHRRGTAVVAEGAQAPVRDARLRGRWRGDAEAQGPRRRHAARRGQAGRAGRLDRRHGHRPQRTSRQEESD